MKKKGVEKVVAVSGGFDPIHIGHIRMFEEARRLGDKLVVILNNDNWLQKKKGYVFMDEKERKEILLSLRSVDEVVITKHKKNTTDMSVCDALRAVKPDIFANGGDRTKKNIPEIPVCKEIGSKMVFSVGKGGKVQSSSWLVNKSVNLRQK
ncbi:MAG: symbB [Candidatus Taylorbacteria bacterium]|nr:symbB [Candidatus Taylorbacteria bacterium]